MMQLVEGARVRVKSAQQYCEWYKTHAPIDTLLSIPDEDAVYVVDEMTHDRVWIEREDRRGFQIPMPHDFVEVL